MFGHKHMLSREGGIEIVVYELATRLSSHGYHVVCYDRNCEYVSGTTPSEDIREYQGVKIVPVWTINRRGYAALTSSFFAAVKAVGSECNIIHIHAEGPAAMCGFIRLLCKLRRRKKKIIVTIHGLDWARAKWGRNAANLIKFGEKQAVKHADEIIVLNRSIQEYFKKTYSLETVIIPNGVNRVHPAEADEIRKKWELEKDSYVLFFGRIVPEKGLDYLISAWKKIKTDKKLVIAGGSSDTQSFLAELKLQAREDSRILFTDFQEGRILEELYSNAYLYCLPSDLEGMPISLLEAMSYGNCCVVSDISGMTEAVENRAAVFKQADVEDLRRVLQELLDHPERVNEFRNGIAEYVCSRYNWDDVVDRTLELYMR